MPGMFSIWPPALLSLLGFLSVAILVLLLVKKSFPALPSWIIGLLTVFQAFFGSTGYFYPQIRTDLPFFSALELVFLFPLTCLLLLHRVRSGKNNILLLMGLTAFVSSSATILMISPEPVKMEWIIQVLAGLIVVMSCLYLFIKQSPDPRVSVFRWPYLWIALGALSYWGMKTTVTFTLLCFPESMSGAAEKELLLLFFMVIQTAFYLLSLLFSNERSAESI